MTTEMTVTRALSKIKTLDKNINDLTQRACFVNFKIGEEGKEQIDNCSPESTFDKINSLIQRRDRIKSAIMVSNANTKIKINDETMTVAEAIEKKSSIEYLKRLLGAMELSYRTVISKIDDVNYESQSRLDRMLEANYGKEGRIRESDIQQVIEQFRKTNDAILVDPIDIKNKIETLEEYITSFEGEVDLCLSESNATTKITIED